MFVSVLLDAALDKALDYAVDEGFSVRVGSRVLVPVQKRVCYGTVTALKKSSEIDAPRKIIQVLEEQTLPEELLALAEWIARYYATPMHRVFKTLIPPNIRKDVGAKLQLFVKPLVSQNILADLCRQLLLTSSEQAKALEVLLQSPKGMLLSALLEKAMVSRSPIHTLVKKKVLSCQPLAIDRSPLTGMEYFPTKPKKLSEEQQCALNKIKKSLDTSHFEAHLLYGVTGSGKTEIYLQAIEHTLAQKRGVIFLVPEIALTSQTIERLLGRFHTKIAVLHHRLSPGERFDAWHQIQSSATPIVLGARSAIFSPMPHLGLIIVDEEHEGSYKQSDEAPCYNARDVAVMRGKLAEATVILASATPSLESFYNAKRGKYTLSVLKERAGGAKLPSIQIIDMRAEYEKNKGYTLFSDPLLKAIKVRLQRGEQTLLFLNRRGYHTSQRCTACGAIVQCPHCDLSLTYHLSEQLLACHLCDFRLSPPPTTCPKCMSAHTLKYKGAGTEMVEKALHAVLPEVRTLRLDTDTTRHKGSYDQLFKQFRAGKADVCIGTQMIAKGLHFPAVTLVGILQADSSLNIPDFRAAEGVFQLITQVSGRSGRGQLPGEVLIQAHLCDHPSILHASRQDFETFYRDEFATRELFGYPPLSHFVKLTFSGAKEEEVKKYGEAIRSFLIKRLPSSFQIQPLIPCGRARVKDQYRYQFLAKGTHLGSFSALASQIPSSQRGVKLLINVDPLSTFF